MTAAMVADALAEGTRKTAAAGTVTMTEIVTATGTVTVTETKTAAATGIVTATEMKTAAAINALNQGRLSLIQVRPAGVRIRQV